MTSASSERLLHCRKWVDFGAGKEWIDKSGTRLEFCGGKLPHSVQWVDHRISAAWRYPRKREIWEEKQGYLRYSLAVALDIKYFWEGWLKYAPPPSVTCTVVTTTCTYDYMWLHMYMYSKDSTKFYAELCFIDWGHLRRWSKIAIDHEKVKRFCADVINIARTY